MNAQSPVLYVAEELLQYCCQRLQQVFLDAYGVKEDSSTVVYQEVEESQVKFTSKWLLQHFIIHLHRHMKYKCFHKRFGVVLYRNGGNLVKTLSWALGGKSSAQVQAEEFSHVLSNQEQPFLTNKEYYTAAILNKIHQEVQKVNTQSPDLTH